MTFTGFTGSNLPAFRDDFNRADNVIITAAGTIPWREGSDDGGTGLQITSNQIAASSGALNVAFWDGIEDNHIGWAFTISTFSATAYAVAGCLVTADAGNGVNPIELYFVAANSIEIWYDNSTFVTTMGLSASFASGDQIGFDVEDSGTSIIYKVFRRAAAAGNWAQVGSYTHTGAGRDGPWDPGFGMSSTTVRYDDFYAEAITVSSAATPQMMLTGAGA